MTAQVITFPKPAQSETITKIGAAMGDFLSAVSEASDRDLQTAVDLLLQVSFTHGHNQTPICHSRKKIDKREHARLEVMRRAFCDAAFVVRAEQAHRSI